MTGKYIHTLFFVIILCLLPLTACAGAQETSGSDVSPGNDILSESDMLADDSISESEQIFADGTLAYTNLGGKAVREEVRRILENTGIDGKRIEAVFQWVEDFNQCMNGCESYDITEEFVTVETPIVDYGDYYPMSTMWYKTNRRDYSDVLCRIAAFQLLQDKITVQNVIAQEDWECHTEEQWLCSDWDAISKNPLIDFGKEEQEKYFTLFQPVMIEAGCSPEQMYETILTEWDNRGIAFSEGAVSLITIWTQYENRTAAAHAAVLAENGNGFLLFEKTNPQSPYQASKFSSIEQVKQYMYESIHIEDVRYGDETGTYIVMQNNRRL